MFAIAGGVIGGIAGAAGIGGLTLASGAALGLGAGAAVGGIVSGSKAGKQAGQYASSAAGAADTQAAIAAESWNRYMSAFAPKEDVLLRETYQPVEKQPATKFALAQVDRGYADAAGNLKRSLGGRYQYGSGLERGALGSLERNRIQARAKTAAEAGTNLFNQRLQLANVGRGLPGQAVQAAGSAAGIYGNLAGMYGDAAKSSWDSVGTGIGNLMQIYTLSRGGGNDPWGTGNNQDYGPPKPFQYNSPYFGGIG